MPNVLILHMNRFASTERYPNYSFRILTDFITCNLLQTSPPTFQKSLCAIDFSNPLDLAPFLASTKKLTSERNPLLAGRTNLQGETNSLREAAVNKSKFLSSVKGAFRALGDAFSMVGDVFAKKRRRGIESLFASNSLRPTPSGSIATEIQGCSDKEEMSDDSTEDVLTSVDKDGTSYALSAVVRHLGTSASSGHYIADVFHESSTTWRRCDDVNVVEISRDKVISERDDAYLLVYRRR